MRKLLGICGSFLFVLSCTLDKLTDTASTFNRDQDNVNSQTDTASDSGTNGNGDGTGGGIVLYTGSISGSIDIQLYREVDSQREMLSWEDSCSSASYSDQGSCETAGETWTPGAYPNSFPFGKLFVGAFYYSETGLPVYVAADIIESPTPTNNFYELEVPVTEGVEEVRVVAVLDYYQDNITGTDEPIGGYPRTIITTEIFTETGVDFSVLSPIYEPRDLYPDEEGAPCKTLQNGTQATIEISGEAEVTGSYLSGDLAVFVMGLGSVGPLFSTSLTPELTEDGAKGDYTLEVCESLGIGVLRGCWDRNQNGMFEPMDLYGSYTEAPNVNGNPITIGYNNLSDYKVDIPLFGSEGGLQLLPFMSISGRVKADPHGGTFDELLADTEATSGSLYVAVLKFRPQGMIAVTDIEEIQSYDYIKIEWEDLQGKSEISYTLMAPKETIVYLWTYIDKAGYSLSNGGTQALPNGYVNESREPVSSFGTDDNGRVITEEEPIEGADMILTIMD